MTFRYATRMERVGPSIIREFARLTASPEITSFAGGLPAPELFPIEELKEIAARTLAKVGRSALQYSDTAGSPALHDKIAKRMVAIGVRATADSINILSGSQQGIDFAAKIFLDPGDVVVCERPTYLGTINAFHSYQTRFVDVGLDDEGMIVDELVRVLETYDLDAHILKLRDLYRHRRDLMLEIMTRDFSREVHFTRPEGGLFTWVELPDPVDATELMHRALARKVAFVPGAPFYATNPLKNTLRLNFSNTPDARIVEGMKVVTDVLTRSLAD